MLRDKEEHFKLSSDHFQTVHIDIMGSLLSVESPTDSYFLSYQYLLTMTDRATRCVDASPQK